MAKQDSYPSKSPVVGADYVTGVDSTGPSTVKILLSTILTYIWTLANIPSGGTSPITRDNETQFAFVASGMVWTADNAGVNRNASMTAGICYINGRRISISAVSARTFTASRDTYIDILDNQDGTGTVVYTETTNNVGTGSPALASNSLRIGIIITGASSIAAATSINQGQETMVLPIVSSLPYAVTDSLGNLICPRDPNHKIIGYRQIVGNFAPGTTAETVITGLIVPVIIPANRKIRVREFCTNVSGSTGTATIILRNGTTTGGTQIGQANGASSNISLAPEAVTSVYSGSQNFVATVSSTATNPTVGAASTQPAFIIVELV